MSAQKDAVLVELEVEGLILGGATHPICDMLPRVQICQNVRRSSLTVVPGAPKWRSAEVLLGALCDDPIPLICHKFGLIPWLSDENEAAVQIEAIVLGLGTQCSTRLLVREPVGCLFF